MFQTGTMCTVIATGIALLAGSLACQFDLSDWWLTLVEWSAYYFPLATLMAHMAHTAHTAGAEIEWERRGYI